MNCGGSDGFSALSGKKALIALVMSAGKRQNSARDIEIMIHCMQCSVVVCQRAQLSNLGKSPAEEWFGEECGGGLRFGKSIIRVGGYEHELD
jgi:hypothetical protein